MDIADAADASRAAVLARGKPDEEEHAFGWALPSDFPSGLSKGKSCAQFFLPDGAVKLGLQFKDGQVIPDWTHGLCVWCSRVTLTATSNVGNFVAHARSCNSAAHDELKAKPVAFKPPGNTDVAELLGIVSKKYDASLQRAVRQLTAAFVAESRIPLAALENPKFRALYALISDGAQPFSRFTVRRDVLELGSVVEDYAQRHLITKALGYSITSDGWSSKGNEAFFAFGVLVRH